MRTTAYSCQWSDPGSPSFQRSPFSRDVLFDPGGATAPRITVPLMLRSASSTVSAPAIKLFRGSITHPTRNCCVRFVAVVTAGSRNTHYRAARYGLTRTGLSPAGLRQPNWRLRDFCFKGPGGSRPIAHIIYRHRGDRHRLVPINIEQAGYGNPDNNDCAEESAKPKSHRLTPSIADAGPRRSEPDSHGTEKQK